MTGEPEGEVRRCASAVAVALAIVALGAFVVFEAATGPGNPGYAEVGPGVIPGMLGAALVTVGLCLLLQGLRGQWRVSWIERDFSTAHSHESGNPASRTQTGNDAPGPRFRGDERKNESPFLNVALVAAALILDVVLMPPLGFVVASVVLFTLVAAAFGSHRFVLNAALGLAFAGAIYLVFVHGLGLYLPVGSVWESFPWMS